MEKKFITLDLRENRRGRFLRIIEESRGRLNAVVVPASGLEQLRDVLEKIAARNRALSGKP